MKKSIKTLTQAGALGGVMALAPVAALAAEYNSYDYPTTTTTSSAAAGGATAAVVIIFVLLYIAFIAFCLGIWIWMLVDVIKRDNWKQESDKTLWILIVALLGAIGAVIYYFAVKRPLDKGKKK